MSVERISIIERPQATGWQKSQLVPYQLETPYSITTEKRPDTKEFFDGLPVAKDTNLDWLSPLATNQEAYERMRPRIKKNYEELKNLHKSLGFQENLEITMEIAVALLDEHYLEAIKEEIKQEGRVLKTARHEQGHAIVAASLSWSVPSVTVVPNYHQGYLGATEAVPPANKSIDDLLLESAAISFGGAIAAQMMGDVVRGTGADMASAQAKAGIAVAHPYSSFSSEASFLVQAQNLAHHALRNFGTSGIERQAHILLYKQTIV